MLSAASLSTAAIQLFGSSESEIATGTQADMYLMSMMTLLTIIKTKIPNYRLNSVSNNDNAVSAENQNYLHATESRDYNMGMNF